MLKSLSINNFILIDKMECNFNNGMTTITGESGHGKSIVLDALSLLLGSRCTQEYFRGEEKIKLHAEFCVEDNELAKQYLIENGFDENNECIIRRVVGKEGGSKSFINSIPCTLSDLKKLGKLLIEIHTQNKNNEIFSPDSQLNILDSYSNVVEEVIELNDIYKEYSTKEKALKELISKKESEQSRLELLAYKFKELEELKLEEGEIEELEEESKMLQSAERSINSCDKAQYLCSESEGSIVNLICEIKKEVEDLPFYEDNESIAEIISQLEINADELFSSLGHEKSRYSIDEERYSEVEARLNKINEVANRNHTFPEKLIELYNELSEEISGLDISDEELDAKHQELSEIKERWMSLAEKISETRTKGARRLSEEVTDCLKELNMSDSSFFISVKSNSTQGVTLNGFDNVEFLLAANMGQSLQPIAQVASGGEVSRLNLAIQSLSSNNMKTPTMVFDEVDTGVGGITGIVFGKYLKKISANKQVICITHLPQVMVYGNQYITAKKVSNSNSTVSKIEYINEQELVNEVARMLGNDIIDGDAIAQAKKMINKARD